MKIKKYRHFVGDFETTVYKGQVHTEVWASAITEIYQNKVDIHHSIDETFEYLKSLKCHTVVYYHNLKFDGSFWLPFLISKLKLKQAYEELNEDGSQIRFLSEKEMPNNSFKYCISEMGSWYNIIIKVNNYFIEIRDSYKLLPFSVKRMGDSFKTKHRKLDMDYKGFRYSGCEITEKEKEYIANDVLVVKECLEIMFDQGHDKLTIGSCCLSEYKKIIDDDWDMFFPDMTNVSVPDEIYCHGTTNYANADEYVRRSYRGGWCYVVKGKEGILKRNGVTADVNSLYPSVMHSESGNRYPIGNPYFWQGNFIPDKAIGGNKYFFIRIKTSFYIKENKLPFIQIKGSYRYKGTECLETSDVYNPITDTYSRHLRGKDGKVEDTRVTLTLTMTDYYLILDHYELVDFEILDGCWFYSEIGIFDTYINKYREIKINSEGAVRESAKLFLNNLYGKMASSSDSSFKFAYEKEDGLLAFKNVYANEKDSGYIPVGSAITSYAREFTIRTAQKNYYGVNERGFCYADTDSIHCDLEIEELKGVAIHHSDFCHWSIESKWDEAIFTRQKTYIEHVTHVTKGGQVIEVNPFYDIKCAGMPKRCKDIFELSLREYKEEELLKFDEEIREYVKEFADNKKTILDFNVGLVIYGKLLPKRISGGIVLQDTTYRMS